WEGWAILLRQKQKKLIMLPSETMIWQPEFTDKTLSRKIGAVHHYNNNDLPYKPDPPELRDGGYFYRHLHRHADALFRAKSRHASQGATRAAFSRPQRLP
ncbi:hypothetical protein KX439_25230, partial [Escherichia coli]|nr:hypothetical protein [Escherichia coli]